MSKANIYQTAVYVTVFSVVEKFLGFLYRIILSRTLGSEGMGLYQLALSIFAVLITAASSGIPITVSRLITKHRAEKNKNAEQSTITAAIVSTLVFSVPVFIILFFGHKWFDFLFSDARCMSIFLILLPSLTFNSIYSVIRGVFWGNKQFMPYCVIDLIEEIVMIVAGVLLVTNMTSVLDGAQRAAFAIIISYLFSFSISFVYFFVKGGRLKNPRSQFRPLLHSALPITGMRTSNSLINSVISLLLPARLIAAGFTSQQAMSELGVAMGMSMPILSIPATLIGSLSLVIVPELAENFYNSRHAKLRDNIEKALKVTVLIAAILIPFLFVTGEDMGIFLFSDAKSGEIIRNASFVLLPMSFTMITTSILNSLGYEKYTCIYFFVSAAASLLCTYFLPSVIGVYALFVGMAASGIISSALNLILIIKKCKEKVHFLKHTLLTLAGILPIILLGVLLRNLLVNYLPLYLLIGVCAAVTVGASILFYFAIGTLDPKWLKTIFKKS